METLLLFFIIALLLLLAIAMGAVGFVAYKYFSLKMQMLARIQQEHLAWRERELEPALKEQAGAARREAQDQLEKWREQELGLARKQQLQVARSEAAVQLEQWKKEQEQWIRQDAIQKSQSVTVGKVTEHIAPYLPDFSYNPKDVRFIGSPIDLVVFDGLNDDDVRKVAFVEIKTGTSALSARERRVRDAVQSGRVEWVELRPNLEPHSPSAQVQAS